MIEFLNVTKQYKTQKNSVAALNCISGKLPSRGFVAIYGENGCGKTTFLNVISSLDCDYSGDILYNGVKYNEIRNNLRRNIVSVVLQESQFIDYLNMRENLQLFAEPQVDCEQYASQYGVLQKMENYSCELSGGQKQRMSFIRGIIKNYAVLLVDEPTSSLNADMEAGVFEELCKISKEKLVVLVSHNMSLIYKYADFIMHMDNGQIVSFEKNKNVSIEYSEGEIIVPQNFYNLALIDGNIVKKSLDEKKRLIISVGNSFAQNKTEDYSEPEVSQSEPRTVSAGQKVSIAKKSILSCKKDSLPGILLITILLTSLSVLLLVCFCDRNAVLYKCFKDNVGEVTMFTTHSPFLQKTEDHRELNFQSAQKMISECNSKIAWYYDYINYPKLPFEGSFAYNNLIYGMVVYYNNSYVELVCGRYPAKDEVMITDYTAYCLVHETELYKNEEEILENGLELCGKNIKVSGIIKTDYQEFITDSESDRAFVFEDNCKNVYSCLYYPIANFLDFDAIYNLYDYKHAAFFDYLPSEGIIPDKDYSKWFGENADKQFYIDSYVYINDFWRNQIGDDKLVDYSYYLTYGIYGDVKTDDNFPVIFLAEPDMEILRQNLLELASRFAVRLQSSDELLFLNDYNVIHSTCISEKIRQFENTIFQIGFSIRYFSVVIIAAVFFVCLLFTLKQYEKDKRLMAFMKIGGYAKKEFHSIENLKNFLCIALSLVLSGILTIISCYTINKVFCNSMNCDINVFAGKKLVLPVTYGLFVISFVFAELITAAKYERKQIVALLK